MADRSAPTPPAMAAPKADRAARSAAALRENLARRKAQKRARQAGPDAPNPPAGPQKQG